MFYDLWAIQHVSWMSQFLKWLCPSGGFDFKRNLASMKIKKDIQLFQL